MVDRDKIAISKLTFVGLTVAGLIFFVMQGCNHVKRCGVVLSCLVTRAIANIENIYFTDTSPFTNALGSFIA